MARRDEQVFQQRIQRIETLVQALESFPDPAARAGAQELIQALLELHGAGLEAILELVITAEETGQALVNHLAADDLIGNLLLLHGLHPRDFEERVQGALERVRPYLGSHGGNVELLGVAEGVVHLRLQGSCHGCPSSAMTLKLAIEDAIYAAAPDTVAIEVEGVVAPPPAPLPDFVPLTQLRRNNDPAHGNGNGGAQAPNGVKVIAWQVVGELTSLRPDAVRTLDVAGRSVSFCRVGETFYAYGNVCLHCGQTLDDARLEGPALACPNCGRRYDVQRAGQGLDDPAYHLEPFPLLVERGQVKIALPVLQG